MTYLTSERQLPVPCHKQQCLPDPIFEEELLRDASGERQPEVKNSKNKHLGDGDCLRWLFRALTLWEIFPKNVEKKKKKLSFWLLIQFIYSR